MKKGLNISILLLTSVIFTACFREDRIYRKQAGVWLIKSYERIFYSNGVITSDTIMYDVGSVELYDSGLNGQNQVHYKLNTYLNCWSAFANSDTGLDLLEDYAWWYTDENADNRFALQSPGEYGMNMLIFTKTKVKKNKQTWTVVGSGTDPNSSMNSKEILTVERVDS